MSEKDFDKIINDFKASDEASAQHGQNSLKTEPFAIIGFIFSLAIFAPVGIALSALALRNIKKNGNKGRKLALWGLWIGIVVTIINLALIALISAGLSLGLFQNISDYL